MPFLASQLWALPCAAAGARERRGEPATAAASSLRVRCRRIAAAAGGWASSREGRAEPRRLCSEPGAGLGWISLPA